MNRILLTLFISLFSLCAVGQTILVRQGTPVNLKSTSSITSKKAKVGETIDFIVSQNVVVGNTIIIPYGSTAKATITKIKKAKAAGQGGSLAFQFSYVNLPNGTQIPLSTTEHELNGKNQMGAMAGMVFLTGGFGFLKKGNQAKIEEGFELVSSVGQDIEFSYNGGNLVATQTIVNSAPTVAQGYASAPVVQQQAPVYQQQPAVVQQQPVAVQQTVATASANNVVGKSDVDENIPTIKTKDENAFAIIIANENYQNEVAVKFAANDGRTFKQYCEKTLGIPSEQIHYKENATLNNIKAEVSWLQKVCEAFGGDARIIFYYAGHGIPDESNKDAYLLPVDGTGSDIATGYKLSELYSVLGKLKTNSVSVFLDACFSGAQRGDGMLASARGVALKAKPSAPVGSMVVMSAAQGDETAYPYLDKGHGLFTYFLLKKLQESKGACTMEELSNYVKTQVSRKAIVVNGKPQTPAISYSTALGDKWKKMTLNGK